jgi:Flp pilus assembly protein TadG
MTHGPLRHRWSRAVSDDRGAAFVEFALIFPLLIVLYAVGFEICQAATVNRKLTNTTVQLANILSQYTTVTKSDISTIMNASSETMSPFANSALGIVVTEVNIDANGNATIGWSEAYSSGVAFQGTALTTPPSAPASFLTPSSSYIVVQSTYAYTPVIAGSFMQPMTLTSHSYMLPRDSGSIPCSDC